MEKGVVNGMTKVVDIDAALTALNRTQKWCAKAKSVGFNGKVSAWSAPLCTQSEVQPGPFEAMPWPHIPKASGSSGLNFTYMSGSLINVLAEKTVYPPQPDANGNYNLLALEAQLEAAVSDVKINFTYYRQEVTEDGASNFVQVSDGYPYFSNRNYRYVKVYYTADHEVERYEVSEVVRTGAPPATTTISAGAATTPGTTPELINLNPDLSNLHLIGGVELIGGGTQ